MKKLLCLLLVLTIISCGGDDDNNYETYLEIVVNGKTYRESVVGYGYGSNSQDCNGKSSFIKPFPEITTASHRYTANIQHFYNTVDFNETTTGSYAITGNFSDYDCNLTLSLFYSDTSGNNYFILNNGSHTITRISQLDNDNNDTEWVIEGNFTANFEDISSGESLSISGSHRAILITYQD